MDAMWSCLVHWEWLPCAFWLDNLVFEIGPLAPFANEGVAMGNMGTSSTQIWSLLISLEVAGTITYKEIILHVQRRLIHWVCWYSFFSARVCSYHTTMMAFEKLEQHALRIEHHVRWAPPPLGWWKLNVDESIYRMLVATVSGLVQDANA
ncbi:hypothetical protein Ancab_008011 [Ancistrocladus abbreviatus]